MPWGGGGVVAEAEELGDEGREGEGEEVAGLVGGVGAEEGVDGGAGGEDVGRRRGGGEEGGGEFLRLGEGIEGVGVRVHGLGFEGGGRELDRSIVRKVRFLNERRSKWRGFTRDVATV